MVCKVMISNSRVESKVEDYDDKKCLHLQSSFVEPACSCVRGASFVEQFFVQWSSSFVEHRFPAKS